MMRRSFCWAAVLLLAAGTLQAQAPEIRGRVLDPAGAPVPETRVVLHRVIGTGGANVAETQSDAEGRFTIAADSAPDPEAIYFLAARYEGELYIGEAFRAPFTQTEYPLNVGVPGTSASELIGEGPATLPPAGMGAAAPGSAPATNTRWLLFVIPAIMLVGVVAYLLLRGHSRIPERRRLLAEIAELDLAHAGNSDPGALSAYHERRAALITQVRAADD